MIYDGSEGIMPNFPTPSAPTDGLLVCISPSPLSDRLVSAAHHLAAQSGAEWHALYVETATHANLSGEARLRVMQTLHRAEALGAKTLTMRGRSVAEAVTHYARTHRITKIVAGKPLRARWQELVRGSVVDQIIRQTGELDVYVISSQTSYPRDPAPRPFHLPASWWPYLWSLILVGAVSLLGQPIQPFVNPTNLVMLYLLAVVIAALYWGRRAAVLAALLSVVAFNFFFVPPRFTLHVAEAQYLLTFSGLLMVGLVISTLAAQVRDQVDAAQQREAQTAVLYELGRGLTGAGSLEAILHTVIARLDHSFGGASAIWLMQGTELTLGLGSQAFVLDAETESTLRQHFGEQSTETADADVPTSGRTHFIPIRGAGERLGVLGLQLPTPQPLLPGQYRLLETFASQIALAIARARLAEKAQQAELLQVTERLQTALLNSISHDLRTPLATITGALSSLRDQRGDLEPGTQQELIETAVEEAERMNRLVGNLLDMTRLEAGAMQLTKTPCDVQDLLGVVLAQLAAPLRDRPLSLELPTNLPLVPMDFVLMAQVLGNLLDNALKYSSPGSPLEIVATVRDEHLILMLRDQGIGIPEADIAQVFEKFYRVLRPDQASGTGLGLSISRGIVEAHGGEIDLHSQVGQGTTVWVKLPLATAHRHS